MELQVKNAGGEAAGSVSVAEETFGRDFNEPLVHQAIVAYLAGGRAGTRRHKTRAEVRGGGAKPWRQKGTGRARAGSIRSPLWRSGGVTFAARPQDHAQKLNKKMYRGAMRSIFSELIRQNRLMVVDEFGVAEPRTRLLNQRLDGLGLAGGALLVTERLERDLALAARNLPRVAVRDVSSLDPVGLVGFDTVVITVSALNRVQEWLA